MKKRVALYISLILLFVFIFGLYFYLFNLTLMGFVVSSDSSSEFIVNEGSNDSGVFQDNSDVNISWEIEVIGSNETDSEVIYGEGDEKGDVPSLDSLVPMEKRNFPWYYFIIAIGVLLIFVGLVLILITFLIRGEKKNSCPVKLKGSEDKSNNINESKKSFEEVDVSKLRPIEDKSKAVISEPNKVDSKNVSVEQNKLNDKSDDLKKSVAVQGIISLPKKEGNTNISNKILEEKGGVLNVNRGVVASSSLGKASIPEIKHLNNNSVVLDSKNNEKSSNLFKNSVSRDPSLAVNNNNNSKVNNKNLSEKNVVSKVYPIKNTNNSESTSANDFSNLSDNLRFIKYYSQNVSKDPVVRIEYLLDMGKKFIKGGDKVSAKEVYSMIFDDYKSVKVHNEGLYRSIVEFNKMIS